MSLLLLFQAPEPVPVGTSRFYADQASSAQVVAYKNGGLLQLYGQGPFYLTSEEAAVATGAFGSSWLRAG